MIFMQIVSYSVLRNYDMEKVLEAGYSRHLNKKQHFKIVRTVVEWTDMFPLKTGSRNCKNNGSLKEPVNSLKLNIDKPKFLLSAKKPSQNI